MATRLQPKHRSVGRPHKDDKFQNSFTFQWDDPVLKDAVLNYQTRNRLGSTANAVRALMAKALRVEGLLSD